MAKNKSSISKAQSYKEMGEFWDTHDLEEVWDQTSEAEFEVEVESNTTHPTTTGPNSVRPIEVFTSYAHEDEKLRDELVKHLANLRERGVITNWHDRDISAGEEWNDEIIEHLDAARVILLLISHNFMSSYYCNKVEVERAMERHEAGEALVIPVILSPVDCEGAPFSKLQFLPTDARPITKWEDQNEAFLNVVAGIRKAAEKLMLTPSSNSALAAGTVKTPSVPSIPRPPIVGFVARRDEQGRDIVERLQEELAQQGSQLITLSGPGGIGKSTLAAEAARALKEVFGGRVVWSSADGRTDFTLSTLLDDIGTQLGQTELRPLAPDLKEAQVRALVADPPALIVLDNYETIATEAQRRIEEWFRLAQCSALFTSRPKINSTRNIKVAAMSHEEAEEYLKRLVAETQDAQIFSDKVRQRIYETAEANPYVMQWVVAQIDAAQEPDTVLEELSQGEGDAAERVFDRSFNLPQLGDDGRATLLALSLFVPSATRDALAEVAGFGDDLKRVNETVKNLRALWLIKGLDENRRFTIEGLTRSLAHARLSKDERADEFRKRFVAHFLKYAEAHAQLTLEAFDALEAEKDNALRAIDVAVEFEDWYGVTHIRFALEEFLDLRGYWQEAIRRGEQALKAARSLSREPLIALFAHNLAVIYQRRGELAEARRLYDEGLEINKRLDNQRGIAIALHQLAVMAQAQREFAEARRLYDESLEIEKKLSDQHSIAGTLHQLATLAQAQGELAEARRLYVESLEIEKKLDNQRGIAISLHQLGRLAQDQGKLAEARQLYVESLEINKRLGDQHNIATTLHELGRLAEIEGDGEEAVRLTREALSIFEKLKSPDAEVARWNLERLEAEAS